MEAKEIFFVMGQVLGFVAVVLAILSYQMKTQRRLLFLKLGNAVVNAVHYLFIGAISGMALNLVSPIKYLVYLKRHSKGSNDKVIPILFTLVTAAVGVITWTEWYSVFVFSGMVIHAFCMSFSDPQKVRISLLFTSPMVIVYNIYVMSISGMVYETVAIVSAVIGIIRFRKSRKEKENVTESNAPQAVEE